MIILSWGESIIFQQLYIGFIWEGVLRNISEPFQYIFYYLLNYIHLKGEVLLYQFAGLVCKVYSVSLYSTTGIKLFIYDILSCTSEQVFIVDQVLE